MELKNALLEMDIVPTNSQDETNLVRNQASNAWRMIYRFMDNVKTSMDAKYVSSNEITNQDVDNIIDYIYNGLQNITRNTIGEKL